MSSLTLKNIPNEAKCKRIVHKLTTGSDQCTKCNGRIVFKRSTTYGWCSVCRIKIRPKAATWLKNSKISYQQIFMLIHYWQTRLSPGATRAATGLSYPTIQRWYARFREHIPSDGGEVLSGVIAVDESWFSKKKHGRQTIVIGGIEVDTEQDSIELFLEGWVDRSSHLITDASTSYNGVEWLGYSRDIYNHSAGHFGDSNHIECIWSAMKRHLRKLYGCIPTKHLKIFLHEWEARHNQRSLFESPFNYLKATIVPL